MLTENDKTILRINAQQEGHYRLTMSKKLTREAPGLFIEETLFTCLARFCRHCKSNPEGLEELLKSVVSQFDSGEPARLVDMCTDEAMRADLAQTHFRGITNIATVRPETVLAALWTYPASNELFRECFATWLSDKAREVQGWQKENPDPMADRFDELNQLYKLTQCESDAVSLETLLEHRKSQKARKGNYCFRG